MQLTRVEKNKSKRKGTQTSTGGIKRSGQVTKSKIRISVNKMKVLFCLLSPELQEQFSLPMRRVERASLPCPAHSGGN